MTAAYAASAEPADAGRESEFLRHPEHFARAGNRLQIAIDFHRLREAPSRQ